MLRNIGVALKYDYSVNYHRRRRYVRRSYIVFLAMVFVALVAAVVIIVDSYLEKNRNSPEATTSEVTSSYFTPTTQIFRTPYFQFQTNKNWAEVPSESSGNKYVYRSLRGNLVEHNLTVYVGEVPADVQATHVLPVRLKNKGQELKSGTVSGHCKETLPNPTPEKTVTLEGITFLCDGDSAQQYSVLAGIKGGTPSLSMKRPNGSSQTYTILYNNVTAKPDSAQLYEILSSFQTR